MRRYGDRIEYSTGLSRHHGQFKPRSSLGRVIHALPGRLEIVRAGLINIDERLRVAVEQREPRALDLHHQPVTRPEDVADVVERKHDPRRLIGHERHGLLEAVAELAAEHVAAHQLLIAAETHVARVVAGVGSIVRDTRR